MFARVSTFQGSTEAAIGALTAPVPDEVHQMAGFKGVYTLLNRASGNVMLITLWESEQAMLATLEAANRIRREIANDAGAIGTPVVEMYEVMSQP